MSVGNAYITKKLTENTETVVHSKWSATLGFQDFPVFTHTTLRKE